MLDYEVLNYINRNSLSILSTEDVSAWVKEVDKEESLKPQRLDVSRHSNYSKHSNDAGYHNNDHNNHDYKHNNNGHSNTYHSNYTGTHSNSNSYHNQTDHKNSGGEHKNRPHSNAYGNHTDTPHNNIPGHKQAIACHYNQGQGNGGHNQFRYEDGIRVDDYDQKGRPRHNKSGYYHNNIKHANVVKVDSKPHINTDSYTYKTPHSNIDGTNYYNPHGNYTPHTNGNPHGNNHTNNKGYHVNNINYNQAIAHNNYSTHNNTGFDSTNHIPSKPQVKDMVDGQVRKVSGSIEIFMHSYDKDIENPNSSEECKKVYYDVSVIRTSMANDSGGFSIESYSNNKKFVLYEDLEKGRFVWNTSRVFGENNARLESSTDRDLHSVYGDYEIIITAHNRIKMPDGNYKEVNSDEKVLKFQYVKDSEPRLTVLNGEEFVSFVFGEDKVHDGNALKNYDGLYKHGTSAQQNGLFIEVEMSDYDKDQYQKSTVEIKNKDGKEITENVTWDNGSDVVQSQGNTIKGYAFFSKDKILSLGDGKDNKIRVITKDYYNPKCTMEAGGNVRTTDWNSQDMFIHVDSEPPVLNVIADTSNPTNKDIKADIKVTDKSSGVDKVEVNGKEVTGNEYLIKDNGVYTFVAKDKMGNSSQIILNVNNIDRIKPKLTYKKSIEDLTNQDVEITISAKDDESGIKSVMVLEGDYSGVQVVMLGKEIMKANGDYKIKVSDNTEYTVVASDKAGNEVLEHIKVNNIDKFEPKIILDWDKSWTCNNIEVELFAHDGNGIGGLKSITLPDGTIKKCETYRQFELKYEIEKNGDYIFTVEDMAGNKTENKITIDNIDKDKPIITLLNKGGVVRADSVIVTTVTDYNSKLKSVRYQWAKGLTDISNNNWSSLKSFKGGEEYIQESIPVIKNVEDNYRLYIQAEDIAGNKEMIESDIFNVDCLAEKPVIKVSTWDWTNKDVEVSIDYKDKGSGVARKSYDIDGTNWKDYTGKFSVSTSGMHVINAELEDKAGNVSKTSNAVIRIDKEKPVVTGKIVGSSKNSFSIEAEIKDKLSGTSGDNIRYSVDNGKTWSNWTHLNKGIVKAEGLKANTKYEVLLQGRDNVGNIGDSGTLTGYTSLDGAVVKVGKITSTTADLFLTTENGDDTLYVVKITDEFGKVKYLQQDGNYSTSEVKIKLIGKIAHFADLQEATHYKVEMTLYNANGKDSLKLNPCEFDTEVGSPANTYKINEGNNSITIGIESETKDCTYSLEIKDKDSTRYYVKGNNYKTNIGESWIKLDDKDKSAMIFPNLISGRDYIITVSLKTKHGVVYKSQPLHCTTKQLNIFVNPGNTDDKSIYDIK